MLVGSLDLVGILRYSGRWSFVYANASPRFRINLPTGGRAGGTGKAGGLWFFSVDPKPSA